MNTKLIVLSIFAATAVTVTFFPSFQHALAITNQTPVLVDPVDITAIANQRPKIEVVFVLDTTGSMSGLIDAAKEKIWSIANTMASAQTAPDIKMGLVAYRDRGDAYITQTVPLSSDLDSIHATLMDFQADGGGDSPESVNQALDDAINKISWSQDQNSYKVVFLIGDAPPHLDYQDDIQYPQTLALAKQKGIIINAIQCGQDSVTAATWQQIASLGLGDYFQVDQSGNAVALATPFDKKLADLSAKLDDTRLYYGDEKTKVKQGRKLAAAAKLKRESSEKSLARRATFNVSESGEINFLGEGELVDAIILGNVELASIAEEELPKSMQAMSIEQQQVFIAEKNKHRQRYQQEIADLAKKRDNFLTQKVAESGEEKDSLDGKIYSSIKKQAKEKGLIYDEDSAKY